MFNFILLKTRIKMKTINLFTGLLWAAALLFISSCQKDEVNDTEEKIIETDIIGVVQKGPFNVGTTVTLSELNENLSQTGKTFVTQINTDDGSFELADVQLSYPIVTLKADGFYFDEVKGENSAAQLTLNAIADVANKSTLNINVLTHLEKPRVEYLLTNGYSFSEAKTKAKQEVLSILGLSGTDDEVAEELDITKQGTENACLLALSSVVQGYRSVADVSELLTYIANDLKEDGTLDNTELQTDLISHALFIHTTYVRNNLTEKYNDLEGTIQIPDFGQYLEQFVSTTTYTPVNLIDYPEQSSKGLNILNEKNDSVFESELAFTYSMAAKTIPGIPLKIELKVIEGDVGDYKYAAGWGYRGDKINWDVTQYDYEEDQQVFEIIDVNLMADIEIIFRSANIKVQVKYMEGTRERTRIITIN